MMKVVGLIGWRGIVGSVLLKRMQEENDFLNMTPVFFSTSQCGQNGPVINNISYDILKNAYDINLLKKIIFPKNA